MTPRAIGYVRLSRDEVLEGYTIEEKLEDRAGQVRELAARHNLQVTEILRETESGTTIADRPVFLRLLALCKRGDVTHIVTPEQARVLRGDKRDEAEIEDTFTEAGITLVSFEGVLDFGSDEFDPLPYEVRALVARHEVRQYVKRRKRANAEKLRQNQRYAGAAPYGYRTDPNAPGGYSTIPHEYAVVKRIFEHILAGGSFLGLARALDAEGIPPPHHRNSGRGTHWHHNTIRKFALNSFYAGRHRQCVRVMKRGGKKRLVELDPDEYVISPIPGEWPHPITFPEWLDIRSKFTGRRRPKPPTGLLTGTLYCQDGVRMSRGGQSLYICACQPKHPGQAVSRTRIEAYAVAVCRYVFDHLPSDVLGAIGGDRPARSDLLSSHAKAQRDLKSAKETVDDLMRNATRYMGLFGPENYDESARRARLVLQDAQLEYDRLSSEMNEPAPEEIEQIVGVVRKAGFDVMWSELSNDEQRAVISSIIERIQLAPKGEGKKFQHRSVELRLHGWVMNTGVRAPKWQLMRFSGGLDTMG